MREEKWAEGGSLVSRIDEIGAVCVCEKRSFFAPGVFLTKRVSAYSLDDPPPRREPPMREAPGGLE